MTFDAVVSQPYNLAENSDRLQDAIFSCDPIPGVLLWGGFMPFQHQVAVRLCTKTDVSLIETPCSLKILTDRFLKLLKSHDYTIGNNEYNL